MDTRDIYKLVREFEEEDDNTICLHDSVDLELNENFVIETGVVDFTDDGIVLHLDEDAIEFLDFHGIQLNEEYMGFEKVKAAAKKSGAKDPGAVAAAAGRKKYGKEKFQKAAAAGKKLGESFVSEGSSVDAVRNAVMHRIRSRHLDLIERYGLDEVLDAIDDVAEFAGSGGLDEIGSSDISAWVNYVINDLKRAHPLDEEYVSEDNDSVEAVKNAVTNRIVNRHMDVIEKYGPEKVTAAIDEVAEFAASGGLEEIGSSDVSIWTRQVIEDLEKGHYDESEDTSQGLDEISEIRRLALDEDNAVDEAKYQGREVPLGKPMQGDVKKSKVYVRKPNGKVVKVNFGDKNMRIKKNSPSHRKSFRARHHCENPGPRWKARYWSCRAW